MHRKIGANASFAKKYGPWALVAGASYGLGAAWAQSLAKRGLNLILIARGAQQLEQTAADLRSSYTVEIRTIAMDLADSQKAADLIRGITEEIGLFVYNAAVSPVGPFSALGEEQIDAVTAVNIKTPLLLCRILAPKMLERGRGGILLMSSLAGSQGSPRLSLYAASKSFLAVLAEALWKEMGPGGVDVCAPIAGAILTPGYLKTQKGSAPGAQTPEAVAEAGLKALGKGPIRICGAFNSFVRFLMTRLLSRKTAVSIMAANTGSLS